MDKRYYLLPKDLRQYYNTVNVRQEPNTNSEVVAKIPTSGKLAIKLGEYDDGKYTFINYQLENGIKGWIRTDVLDYIELNDIYIEVPYINQNDINANLASNDCGIAAVAMLGAFKGNVKTVNELVKRVGLTRNQWTTFNHMIQTAGILGIKVKFQRPFSLIDGYEYLSRGLPYIALINYNAITRSKTFPHFVVVNGVAGESLLFHDPYNPDLKEISLTVFGDAIVRSRENGNMPFQALTLEE